MAELEVFQPIKKRVCKEPGCTRKLCRTNKSGYCNHHVDKDHPAKRREGPEELTLKDWLLAIGFKG